MFTSTILASDAIFLLQTKNWSALLAYVTANVGCINESQIDCMLAAEKGCRAFRMGEVE